MKAKDYPELIFKFILVVLGFTIIIFSLRLGFGTFKKPGPGLVPFLSGLIILISTSDIIPIIFAKKKVESKLSVTKHEIKTYLLMVIVFSLWVIVMPSLGYVLVTFVATFCFCKVMGLKGWQKPLILSVTTTLLAYLLFDYFLYTDLPRGLLG